MSKKINYYNFSLKKYSSKKNKNSNLRYIIKLIDTIKSNLNLKRDIFNTFSGEYNYDFKLKDLKKFQKFKKVVVIGVGGSILGSKSVYSFLKYKINKEFLFLDNLEDRNSFKLNNFISNNKVLFIAISKSGNTIETLANLSLIKKMGINSKNTILISE